MRYESKRFPEELKLKTKARILVVWECKHCSAENAIKIKGVSYSSTPENIVSRVNRNAKCYSCGHQHVLSFDF